MSTVITLALTGASGMPYALRLLETLLQAGHRVHVLYTPAAQFVLAQEVSLHFSSRSGEVQHLLCERYAVSPLQLQVFARDDWSAPIASGSGAAHAMVVCPCTMGTLSAIAHGASDNLLERAADVMLKERRLLILVPRETPFSTLHLENMLKLSRMGAVILPPNPGFYYHPASISDLVDFVVGKILDQLQVPHTLTPRWGE